MAIDPSAFFALQNQVQTENRLRDQSDANLSNSFMGLTSLIMRLTQELGMMTSTVSAGQKQENTLLTSLTQGQELQTKGILGKTVQEEMGAAPLAAGGLGAGGAGGGGMGGMASLLGGGLAAGGLASILGNVLGSPGDNPPGDNPPGGSPISGPAPPEIKALMETISGPESGGNYEAMNPSTTLPGATKMTIAQVSKTATGAVGRYQNMPEYLPERAKLAKLDFNKDLYSPENQDKMTRAHIASLLGGEQKAVEALRKDPGAVAKRLSGTWTSLPGGKEQQLNDQQFSSRYKSSLQKYQPQSQAKSSTKGNEYEGGPSDSVIKASSIQSQKADVAQVTQPPEDTSQGMIASVPALTAQQNPAHPARSPSQTTGDPSSGNPLSTISALSMGIQVG